MPNRWLWPVQDHGVGTAFGVSGSQWSSGQHTGVDFTANGGSPVQAVSGGKVVLARTADYGSPYGNYVIVDHGNGVYSLYAHLSGFNVHVGETLNAGQHIGQVGATGNAEGAHLHFEIRKGDYMSPSSTVNPVAFLENHDAGNGGGSGPDNGRENGGGGGKDGDKVRPSDFGFDPEFLKQHPEIDKLVDRAVKGEWSEQRFAAALKNTRWWERTDQARRDWQMLQAEDPATAKDKLQDYQQQIRTMAKQLGVSMSDRDIKQMADRAAANGWDNVDIQLKVGAQFRLGNGKGDDGPNPQTGQAATVTTDLERMADDFAVPMSRHQKAKWTRNILQGQQTVEGYADILRERAKALYPHLADAIDRAGSVRSWADAYLQQASNMLGVSPDTMALDKGKYAQILKPGQNGEALTMDEWERTLRTDQKFGWDKTNQAQSQAAQLATALAQKMGAM